MAYVRHIQIPDGSTYDIQSGHTVQDSSGTSMTQREGLRFENATLTDDETNNATIVTIPEPIGEQHTVTGNPLSFVTESAQVASNTVITLEPIQAGSGDPSPSNVRAISGYDKVELAVPRKNLFDIDRILSLAYSSKTDNIYKIWSANLQSFEFIKADEESTYTVSLDYYGDPERPYRSGYIQFEYTDQTIDYLALDAASWEHFSFTSDSSKNLKRIYFDFSNDLYMYMKNFQIELGSTATTYEPYNPATDISLTLNDTIYGGTLDVESGELVVDCGIYAITGNENWVAWGQAYYAIVLKDALCVLSAGNVNVRKCEFGIGNSGNNINDGQSGVGANDRYIYIDSTTHQNIANLVGNKIVYTLATPLTYHLTPHQVSLLLGANTVTTNGTSISLTYRDGQIAGLSDLDGVAESVEGLGVSKYSHEEANVLGAKNLNSYPYYETTKTLNGITFTDNGDGTITVTGTAIADAKFYLQLNTENTLLLNKGTYILNGCPKNGSASNYYIYMSRAAGQLVYDYGEGVNFKVDEDGYSTSVIIFIASGYACPAGGLTFKPMIRLASDPDDTWAPYAMTNRELTEDHLSTREKITSDYRIRGYLRNGIKIINIVDYSLGIDVTFPSKYCPAFANCYFALWNGTKKKVVAVVLTTAGKIVAANSEDISSSDYLYGEFVYI